MIGLSNTPGPVEVVKVSRQGRVTVIETMRFLMPYQAKREAKAKNPATCHHNSRSNDYSRKDRP
jgi:hypothetical protein